MFRFQLKLVKYFRILQRLKVYRAEFVKGGQGTSRLRSQISWCNFSRCVAFRRLVWLIGEMEYCACLFQLRYYLLTTHPEAAIPVSPSVSTIAFHWSIYIPSENYLMQFWLYLNTTWNTYFKHQTRGIQNYNIYTHTGKDKCIQNFW
jgi:hypothetical protein